MQHRETDFPETRRMGAHSLVAQALIGNVFFTDVLQNLNLGITSLEEILNLQSVKDGILDALNTLDLDSLNLLANVLQ